MKYLFPFVIFFAFLLTMAACKKQEPMKTDNEEIIPNDTTTRPDCNGYPSLCDSTYDRMTFVMPHNAHAYTPVFNPIAANQERDIPSQLADGVRAFTFKTYYTDETSCGALAVYVYHGFSAFGCTPFSDRLDEIATFMAANPREVITIGIEGNAGVLEMEQSFKDAGLDIYFHVQTLGAPWPTLGAMIDSNKRLVVFTDRGSSNDQVEGFHNYWKFIVDNDYNAEQLSDFDCEWYRGDPNGGLYLFNHFITRVAPQRDSAQVINSYDKLNTRIQDCMQYQGRKPNFLHLDFYNLGDGLRIADEMNGIQ